MASERAGFPERYIGLTEWVHLLKAWPGAGSHEAYQVLASVAVRVLGDLFGCTLGNHQAASFTTLRPEIYDPISALDYIEMMLNDDDCVAVATETKEDFDELVDVS